MGSWVSASFGYGIALPMGEDRDEEYTPSEWVLSVQPSWADEEDLDWESVASALGLSFSIGYVQDYDQGGVLFGGKPLNTYQTIEKFTHEEVGNALIEDARALREAAEKIGIPFDPAYFLVVSYG